MLLGRRLGPAALALASVAAGWTLNERLSAAPAEEAAPLRTEPSPSADASRGFSVLGYPRPPEEAPPAQAAAPGATGAASEVTLFGDGTVTIAVQKRPWRWVLEEVARQQNARGPAGGNGAAPPAVPSETTADPQQILQAIRSGDEKSRYEALLNARSTGTVVPDDTLKQLFEIDASDRVRLLAFENYLERKSGSAAEVRAALEAAQNVPSPAIQAEARKLLEQLGEQERGDPMDLQTQGAGS